MRPAFLTSTTLCLALALAETVPWDETLTQHESSFASVRLGLNFLGLGGLQPSYPPLGACVSLSTCGSHGDASSTCLMCYRPLGDQYVRIDGLHNAAPECVFYSGTGCDGEKSSSIGSTFVLPKKLAFLPRSYGCSGK